MSRKALLINFEYCTGCHSCEVACRVEHGYPDNQGGIIVSKIGPWLYGKDAYQYSFVPAITDQCDQCVDRLSEGKMPTCVHHCQAAVMSYGEATEMVAVGNNQPGKSMLYLL